LEFAVEPIKILSDQLNGLTISLIALAPNLAAAMIVMIITGGIAYLVGRIVSTLLRRTQSRPSLIEALSKLARIGVWIVGIMIVATIISPNLTPTKLLAGLGIGSIAIGLAFKDIFENFLAGFLILLRKPMRIGDDIECENLSGQVEHISIRDTSLRKRSGELVLVPNSFLFKNPVKILTDQPIRRISIIVGVAYGEDVDVAREVVKNAVESVDQRDTQRPVQVFAQEFSSSSIDFMVRWWAKSTPVDEHKSRDAIVTAIKVALDNAGIEIPFPHRTLTFKEPLAISRTTLTENSGDVEND